MATATLGCRPESIKNMAKSDTATRLNEEAPPFSIGVIESIDPPEDGAGKYWCRYTIVQGPNTITGYRQGGVKAVRKAVGEIVADMNQRRMGKRGRVHLTPPSKPRAN
jgi:hypothetical protein